MSMKIEKEGFLTDVSTQDEPEKQIVKWYRPNPQMTTSKLAYLFGMAKQTYAPQMVLFLTSVGLSPKQAGFINGIRFIGHAAGAPIFGMIADRTKAHRCVICIICIAAMLLNCSQPFVALSLSNKEVNQCPLPSSNTSKSILQVNKTAMISTISDNKNTEVEERDFLFYSLLFLNIVVAFFDGSTTPFIDAAVLQRMKQCKTKCDFGRQRLFGAVGYGCGALIMGMTVDVFPQANMTCYSVVFFVYFVFLIALTISANQLLKGLSFASKSAQEDDTRKVSLLLIQTLKQVPTIFFLLTVLMTGVLRGTHVSFTLLFMRQLGASNSLMGAILAIGSLSSICMFFFSSWIIKRCGGTLQAMCLGLLTWSIRLLVLTFCSAPWQIAALQIMHGISFGVFVSAAIQHVKVISPSPVWTSMSGVVNALLFGAGIGIASAVGGVLIEKLGIRKLFMVMGILGFSWCILMTIYIFITARIGYDRKKISHENELIIGTHQLHEK